MEEQSQIPISKIRRAGKFVRTGAKVGGNYLKAYSQKLLKGELDQEALDQKNAEDIYETLSELKGSALKVAQMLSMDKGVLPKAFSQQFSQAQSKAPALSGPLILRTIQKYLGKSPLEIFDEFEMKATHAASIGQVHKAKKDGQELAIKIQYPGVGDSVISDLKLVRPIATRMLGFKDQDVEMYFQEVKERLLEETDYALELKRSVQISEACKDLPNLFFASYLPEYSSDRILTMTWLEGLTLEEFLAKEPSQEIRNQIGQAMWDFYNYQIHVLKIMHADAHPGNYLFREIGELGVLDFGCVKDLPEDFYQAFIQILNPEVLNNDELFLKACYEAQILVPGDSQKEIDLYASIFRESWSLISKPFISKRFDFGDKDFFDKIYAFGDEMSRNPALRNSRVPRGHKDGIYLNRTYFGLFSILHELEAEIDTQRYAPVF
ncbi:MAG: AarF/UbiB family protein [Bacteroidia bacterium]|nr:AarF/UbiB family protein [Bacteroidia bacterium]